MKHNIDNSQLPSPNVKDRTVYFFLAAYTRHMCLDPRDLFCTKPDHFIAMEEIKLHWEKKV